MDYYSLPFEKFGKHIAVPFHLVENTDALNQRITRIAVDAIRQANDAGREVFMIVPVGPIDLSYWADLCNQQNVTCAALKLITMDENLTDAGQPVSMDHPLSFRGYVEHAFVQQLKPGLRPDPANVQSPDPVEPEKSTEMIESHGGADLCFGGCGITGHFAFNDPPEPDEPCKDDEVRNWKTRALTIARESITQMCMGGTDGNWDIIPTRAVTLGMYELLMTKKIHLTFMRNWHAGVLRRVLFGPMNGRCPGSFIQQHPNFDVTLTHLAAATPRLNLLQATGEVEADSD